MNTCITIYTAKFYSVILFLYMKWTDYLNNYSYDLCSRFWSPSALGGYFVQITVFWGHTGCLLSGVESREVSVSQRFQKYYLYIGRAIRGMEFFYCIDCPPFGESVIRGFTAFRKLGMPVV